MSKEQKVSGSGRPDQSQPEIPSPSPGGQTLDPGLSTSCLTIENVKKLEEDYPAAKASLSRHSVETYLQQSNLLGDESEGSQEGRREPNLPKETGSEAQEETAENDTEPLEIISNPDFQRRPLTSSAPEIKKHEFADLETQTEWSYSTSSRGSSEEAKRTLGQEKLEEEAEGAESEAEIVGTPGAERRGTIEVGSIDSSEEAVADMVLESLLRSEDHYITDICTRGFCEFCAAALKPFPTPEELEDKPEKMDYVPCCRTYKEILQCVMQELMETQGLENEIDISPHRRLSQTLLNSQTKSFLMEELQEHGIENYKEVFEQYMRLGPWIRVGYKLSEHGPRRTTVAAKKRPRPKELLKIDVEFKPEQVKICHPVNPVKKYYPDGKIFFLLLPDGTGQVYYPSGNIAILITYLKDVQFTYIILADRSYNQLMAFFTNQGYAACYYPNGDIRVQLDLCYGSSFDERGSREKHWNWWDYERHVHAPPFQPICIQLNIYIQVKIKAQDQIFLTFTKLHNCIHLNVGARLKLKDPTMLPFLKSAGSQKPLAKALQIKTLLAKLRKELRHAPSGQTAHLDHMALILSRLKHWQRKAFKTKNQSERPSS